MTLVPNYKISMSNVQLLKYNYYNFIICYFSYQFSIFDLIKKTLQDERKFVFFSSTFMKLYDKYKLKLKRIIINNLILIDTQYIYVYES